MYRGMNVHARANNLQGVQTDIGRHRYEGAREEGIVETKGSGGVAAAASTYQCALTEVKISEHAG